MDFTNSQNEGYQIIPAIMLVSNSRRCLNLVEQSVGAASVAICAVKLAAKQTKLAECEKTMPSNGNRTLDLPYLPTCSNRQRHADRLNTANVFILIYHCTFYINVYSLFSPLPPLPPRSARGIPSGARYPYVRYSLKARWCPFSMVSFVSK